MLSRLRPLIPYNDMDTTLKIEKQDLNATPITEEHQLFFGHVFRGKSAYQYAIESGLFSGTEEEFAEYLGNIGNVTDAAEQATNSAKIATSQTGLAIQEADDAARLATDAANSADIAAENAQDKADLAAQEAQNAMEAGREALSIAENKGNEATTAANEAGAEAVRIATEAATQATTAANEAENATEQANEATTAANEAAARANEEVQNLREKADTEGYYPNMSVGMADNLVGRGDVQDAQINFRPSGGVPEVGNGMNITDGTARIKAIKGNSVVYNQRLATLLSPTATGNTTTNNGITFTKEDDGYFHVSGSNTSGVAALSNNAIANYNFSIDHKYLFLVDGLQKGNIQAYLLTSQTSHRFSENGIVTAVANEKIIVRIIVSNNVVDVDERVRCAIIDLTKMFDAGNEPTTVEEYYQRKPINIDDYAYNEGEIIDMKVNKLVSVGDNAYNPYGDGYIRVMGNMPYHITAPEGYSVYFIPFSLDSVEEREIEPIAENLYVFPYNGYCTVSGVSSKNICVCLEHSYEKPIKPYEVNVKDLSWIKDITDNQDNVLFPNGMRSAGIAHDEIKYNPTKKCWVAVKRIADVELSSLNWLLAPDYTTANFKVTVTTLNMKEAATTVRPNIMCVPYIAAVSDASVAESKNDKTIKLYNGIELRVQDLSFTDVETFKQSLQGVTLYYELATPIEVDIPDSENWNLDYPVWDFGSEEAISEGSMGEILSSAPFRAEINYEPNAVDDLRWSIKYIRALEQRVLVLEQKAEQETNIEEV